MRKTIAPNQLRPNNQELARTKVLDAKVGIFRQHIEPRLLAVDRILASEIVGVCPRSFDKYFGSVPRVKIGARTLYLIEDLAAALKSMRVDESSPMGNRTTTENLGETASDPQGSAKSDAEGAH